MGSARHLCIELESLLAEFILGVMSEKKNEYYGGYFENNC
jgi:hypothetical protein